MIANPVKVFSCMHPLSTASADASISQTLCPKDVIQQGKVKAGIIGNNGHGGKCMKIKCSSMRLLKEENVQETMITQAEIPALVPG
ncbi:MAG: hypothetical protein ACE5DN_02510 [Flavobacteriales bacterium]